MLTFANRSEKILLFCLNYLFCNFETVRESSLAEEWLQKTLDCDSFDPHQKQLNVFGKHRKDQVLPAIFM